ncbi:SDR family NAD(P)-dependent oxidoreductase [Sphingomonas jatrophae]|uniref:Gluconate 5-dehydrogenase/3-oxoacyl-[acyl-carrier protein] reductase n=1 Tax=Sphingomonas jatrophae TaxID=1166337 RepID=A0A1I6M4I6_9SPHN|nr:SDR family oxidoreductase [Sphingomonas jatrophae]SFS10625.1 gluconate 5-dehydrogenase/3-oxoacyl-[acyl-carrier protein] reductase [Sphingomonas jatrophae]
MSRFSGRVGLVTGAGRGIGHATAVELAKGGAALAINDIDEGRLEEAADELRGHGAEVSTHVGSVMDPAFVATLARDAVARHGRIDLLANNAGGGPPMTPWGEFAKSDFAHFRAIFEMNFFTQAMLLHALLPGMVERGYGKVVCVSSISAVMGQEAGSAYASGKLALHALVSSVSKEVARHGVNINAVILGNPPHFTRTPARQAYLDKLSHIDRVGRLEEFGKAIAFLLSDDASYITGAAVPVDGGTTTPRLNE